VPGAGTWSARASLATDIEQALACLNARLEKADYDRDAKVLIWMHEGHSYAFRPREIKSAPARDRGFVAGTGGRFPRGKPSGRRSRHPDRDAWIPASRGS